MTDPTTSTVEEFTLYSRPGASLYARTSSRVGPVIPALLFIATLVTTSMMGARFEANFALGISPLSSAADLVPISWILQNPLRLVLGLPFSATVMAILLAHELGHYFACRRHGVESSLPYFLPAPTLSGTAGAIIRLRSRVKDRRALLDIGASGPLWGFLFAAPLALVGLLLSRPLAPNTAPAAISLNTPVFQLLNHSVAWMRPGWPAVSMLQPHPMLIAAWIGMFVTFLNLLPAGQLDGGHILYALAPRSHRWVSNATSFTLLLCGIFFWIGWLLWGIILMMPFMRHPRIAQEPRPARKDCWLAIAAFVLLLLTVTPIPFSGMSVISLLR